MEGLLIDLDFSKPSAISIIKSTRDASQNAQPDSLTPAQKLEKVLEEIIETEESYVNDVSYVIEHYYEPLQKIISEDELKRIFSNIVSIRDFNNQLLKDFQNPFETIPEVFLRMSPYLRLYGIYCADYKTANVIVQELLQSRPEFRNFCQQQKEANKLSLSDYLIKPVQRLLKYPLFFNEIAKLTPEDHPDQEVISKVIALLKKETYAVNDDAMKGDNLKKVFHIDQMLTHAPKGFILVQPSRMFITEHTFTVCRPLRASTKEHLLLFSDSILFTEDKQSTYVFKRFIMLDSSVKISIPQAERKKEIFSFDLVYDHKGKEEIYTMGTKDKSIRDRWVSIILEHHNKAKDLEARRAIAPKTPPNPRPAGRETRSLSLSRTKEPEQPRGRERLYQSSKTTTTDPDLVVIEPVRARSNSVDTVKRSRDRSRTEPPPTATLPVAQAIPTPGIVPGHRKRRSRSFTDSSRRKLTDNITNELNQRFASTKAN